MRVVDLERWPRRALYEFFSRYDYPHFNVCAQLDVTEMSTLARARDHSFFRCALYVVTDAVNSISELRYRVREQQVVEHDRVHPRFTTRSEDGLFRFCPVRFMPDPAVFFAEVERAQRPAAEAAELFDEPGRDDLIFVSAVPWIAFTGVVHPINLRQVDSVPRIVLGKAHEVDGRIVMPLAAQVHHGLADGHHLAQLFEGIEARAAAAEELFSAIPRRDGGLPPG